MQTIAVRWEVMDRREVPYMLYRREDWKSDVALLRRRFHNLLDAPPLHDCMRFPCRELTAELLAFNRAYREQLERCRCVDAANCRHYQEALCEAEKLHDIWDAIRDTRCEYYFIAVRRQALKKVRDLIGAEAFYNGIYPPHVPVWRFQHID
jgi:hypothetical protein